LDCNLRAKPFSSAATMNGKESNYMRQLDGLRALCVAAVAWSHWGPLFGFDTKSFPGADIGVEAFFVISGFLITGILLDNRSDELRPQVLKQFYIRRFLRIFPVFYVALGLVFLLNVDGARPVWIWHAGYLSNLWFYMHGWGGALSHFWSLAVEEQFYLFWPVFIFMVPRKYLLSAVMLVILIAPVYALFMNVAHPGVGRVTSSVLMPSCLGALGWALCWRIWRVNRHRQKTFCAGCWGLESPGSRRGMRAVRRIG
jgi:peptidoglycan/LPS O-acetylase OafA/YrhL